MKYLTLFAFVLVAACSEESGRALDHIATTYPAHVAKRHELAGDVWNIVDRPDIGKMMIRVTIGAASAEGRRRRLEPGTVDRLRDDAEFRPAAAQYLASRGCRIERGRLIDDGIFEYDYSC